MLTNKKWSECQKNFNIPYTIFPNVFETLNWKSQKYIK